MKKNVALILIMILLFSTVSCRQSPQKHKEEVSDAEQVVEEVIAKEVKQKPSTASDKTISETQSTQQTSSEKQSSPTVSDSQPSEDEEKVYESTIVTPESVRFYKDGMYGVSDNKKLNLYVAKRVESWYKDYENDTLPLTKTAVNEEMIAEIKHNEMVVEICFNYDQEVNLLGKIKLENTKRLLIPLTGDFAYYVFRGNNDYDYKSGLHRVNGSGLEKYFEGFTLDKEVNDWQSTVIAPSMVTLYKNGKQSVSTDKELNQEIAKHIEEWFKYEVYMTSCNCYSKNSDVATLKHNEMAIELVFNDQIDFYGGYMPDSVRTIFIPLTGEDDYVIFAQGENSEHWSHYYIDGSGLEKYFEGVAIDDEIKIWQSTVIAPTTVTFYKDDMKSVSTDKEFNHKIAKHIEEWFKYQKQTKGFKSIVTTDDINYKKENTTAIELVFDNEFTFYGGVVNSKVRKIFISIDGEHPNHIYTNDGKSDSWGNFAPTKSYIEEDLEQFFPSSYFES